MAGDIAPRDQNRNIIIQAASLVDGISPVNLWADPVTHELLTAATIDTSLVPLNVNITGPIGRTGMSSSIPVTIASDQPPTHVTSTFADGGVVINDANNNQLFFYHNGDSTGTVYGPIIFGGGSGNAYSPYIDSLGNARTLIMDAQGGNRGANVNALNQLEVATTGLSKTLVSKSGSASSNGNNTIVAAGTNKLKIYAFSLSTSSTTALTVKFQDGASGTDLWSVLLQAPTSITTGANLAVSPPAWLFNTSTTTLLNLNISSANAVQWSVSYFDEA